MTRDEQGNRPMTKTLVERLEEKAIGHSLVYGGLGIYQEAKSRIEELERAVRPFAEACAHLHPLQPDDGVTLDGFTAADFRRAALALSDKG